MAALATLADLEDVLGRTLTIAEQPKADASLRYASNMVRAFATWVDALAPIPESVVDVVVSLAARRFFAQLDGATSRTVGQVSVQYDSTNTATFTADERVLLNAALGLGGNLTVSIAQ